ncbi:MAG TPA: hypothetical protein VJ986_10990 [Gaiellaceae bacterium]|nr:hypothetical protein [Gaiellaceae bacterium]
MPRVERRYAFLLAVLVVAVLAVLLADRRGGTAPPAVAVPAKAKRAVRSPPRVELGNRVIVVLRTRSLADRVAAAGGPVSAARERAWTQAVLAAQHRLLARLARRGVTLRPEASFVRVLDGFSSAAGPGTVPLIEQDRDVAGVYPVRAAEPVPPGRAAATPRLTGADGYGVTIALLDTGVDAGDPSLRGRILDGIDLTGAPPAPVERYGTEAARRLVGAAGAAPGAAVLPIRVAAAQQDGHGGRVVYARTDQVIAGLERAVDPNDDGDAHDAVRVALVPLTVPLAAFADAPERRAVAGALALGTLVVTPPGPEGAGAVLTAGAAAVLAQVRPTLDAAALRGLLAGTARHGRIDLPAAAAAEIAPGSAVDGVTTLTNVSTRPVALALSSGGASILLPRGATIRVRSSAGTVIHVAGGGAIRIPGLVRPRPARPLGTVTLSPRGGARLRAVLEIRASAPLARLDVRLERADAAKSVLVARMRDLVPGRYALGLTGRDPMGHLLAPGDYVVSVVATPVEGGSRTLRKLRLALR